MGPGFIATTKPDSLREAEGSAFARYYDLDVAGERDDIDSYLALASASDGPILELACGTGRVCIPLAEAGHRVTGVDRDQYMLDRARDAWERVSSEQSSASGRGALELIRGDITSVRLGRRFDLVILAFNGLLLVGGRRGRAKTLATMRDHLTADGRAVVDIWRPLPDDLELYDGREISDWTRVDPETGERVAKTTVATYEPATQRATIRTRYDIKSGSELIRSLERTDEITFVSQQELATEMHAAGLHVQSELDAEGKRFPIIAALSLHPFHTSRTN